MAVEVTCLQCGAKETVRPSWAKSKKFCSRACKGKWRTENQSGEDSPNWTGGVREKRCQFCEELFTCAPTRAISVFEKQKFCSKKCADAGGFRYTGNTNTKWKDGPVVRSGSSQQRFRNLVLTRDGNICRHCGATENLQAHHIQSIKDRPELRWEVDNGLTLCGSCHSNLHLLKIG